MGVPSGPNWAPKSSPMGYKGGWGGWSPAGCLWVANEHLTSGGLAPHQPKAARQPASVATPQLVQKAWAWVLPLFNGTSISVSPRTWLLSGWWIWDPPWRCCPCGRSKDQGKLPLRWAAGLNSMAVTLGCVYVLGGEGVQKGKGEGHLNM